MPSALSDAQLAAVSSRERQRIAHDLHDGLGQLLGGIALKAQALHETLAEKSSIEAPDAAEIAKLVNEALAQMRLLARGLDPVLPAAEALATTLVKLATNTERLFRIVCSFTGDRTLTLASTEASEQLFRVAQEAINNAICHGRAKRIELELAADAREITLFIRDNGGGLAQRAQPGSGIGLRIMKHRLESLEGTIEMQPGASTGLVVRCALPLAPAAPR